MRVRERERRDWNLSLSHIISFCSEFVVMSKSTKNFVLIFFPSNYSNHKDEKKRGFVQKDVILGDQKNNGKRVFFKHKTHTIKLLIARVHLHVKSVVNFHKHLFGNKYRSTFIPKRSYLSMKRLSLMLKSSKK